MRKVILKYSISLHFHSLNAISTRSIGYLLGIYLVLVCIFLSCFFQMLMNVNQGQRNVNICVTTLKAAFVVVVPMATNFHPINAHVKVSGSSVNK